MSKYYGRIGFVDTEETAPGVYEPKVVAERNYYGDILSNNRRWDNAQQLNDNLNISNRISIVSDPYAITNFHAIRYCEFMGHLWDVSSVEVQYPRLILSIGGVYNGPEWSTD